MKPELVRTLAILSTCVGLAGCATYHPLPLAREPHLAHGLAELNYELPASEADSAARKIEIGKPLDLDAVGLLAMLNDPELRSERGEIGVAQATVVQSATLPNPAINLAYGVLLGGPGTSPSYAASLSQDIASLVTYHAQVAAAEAHLSEVNADQLWREWQTAQKARLLALDLYWGDQSIGYERHELALVTDAADKVQAATRAGNLDLTALSPLATAKASAEQALATLDLNQLKNWQALDALLGLSPDVRFEIATPGVPPIPGDTDSLLSDLPERRPDLVALQLGYGSADETLRAAILGQFPAFTLGGSWNSDTTGVRSAGPAVTFDLPIFNRNQGQVASSQATRLLLYEQYQSRLDGAIGDIRGLLAQAQAIAVTLAQAEQAAASAESMSNAARAAYAQGNLDQRTWTDYETTALERQLAVIDLERSLGEARITLAVELGLGLPRARIAPLDDVQG